jgi:curved DNA-binding protein CbpA
MRFRPEVDYYEILQVHPRASEAMIKKAYRTLMGELGGHPDLGGDEERAKLINEAYRVLSDPDLRRAYDQARESRLPWGTAGGAPPGLDAVAGLAAKVLLSAVVVGAAMMIARLIENPALDLADLAAMVVLLLRIWPQVLPRGRP